MYTSKYAPFMKSAEVGMITHGTLCRQPGSLMMYITRPTPDMGHLHLLVVCHRKDSDSDFSMQVVLCVDIQPAVVQKVAPVPRLLPVTTKCLNDAINISPRCQHVGSFSDATSPRCAYASRVRRSLTLTRQPQGSKAMLPDIPLGRHRRRAQDSERRQ